MASLSSDANGNRTIQFVGGDGKRRSVRLGKVAKKLAVAVKLRAEALSAALIARLPLDTETAGWVAGIGDDLAAKPAAVGLIPARASCRLGEFLESYLDRRKADSKPAMVVTIERVVIDLTRYFGGGTDLRAITEQRASSRHGGPAAEERPDDLRPRPQGEAHPDEPVRRGVRSQPQPAGAAALRQRRRHRADHCGVQPPMADHRGAGPVRRAAVSERSPGCGVRAKC